MAFDLFSFFNFHEFTSQSWIPSPSETSLTEANCIGFEIKLNPQVQIWLEIEHYARKKKIIHDIFQIPGLQECDFGCLFKNVWQCPVQEGCIYYSIQNYFFNTCKIVEYVNFDIFKEKKNLWV